MHYDVKLIFQLCHEVGLCAHMETDRSVKVDVGEGTVLCFKNAESEDDCLIGFEGTPWHTHGDLMFADARGNYVELDYLELVVSLKEGRVLICERQVDGRIVDQWLIHHEYNDEFKDIQAGERITARRAIACPAVKTPA
jgi:hypothetical protein